MNVTRIVSLMLTLMLLCACHSHPLKVETPAPPAALQPEPPTSEEEPAIPPPTATLPESTEIPPCLPVEAPARSPAKHHIKAPVAVSPEPQPVAPEAPTEASVKPVGMLPSVLGKRVHGPDGEDYGRVVDVLANVRGQVRLAVIEWGGFLGVGNRRIAVDWTLLRFPADPQDGLILEASKRELQSTPEYKDNDRAAALMAAPAQASPMPAASAAAPPAADTKK